MSDIAIGVEGLGKRYRIGTKQEKYKTLREKINNVALSPFRTVRSFARSNGHSNSQSAIRNSKSDSFWALKDISFEVKRGEVVGIIGRNGAGKSTLLKILSRITEPTEGYADIHGRVGSLLEVGTGFHPELTGRENIFLNGAILGMKKDDIENKFDEIVSFAEVEQFIDTPVKHYSSGMYLRLAFAVAAHLEPEILVVDEVLAVGDLSFQTKCLGKMQDVAKTGRTILFVSHNTSAITRLCSRAVLLSQGSVIQVGSSAEVVAAYLSDAAGSSAKAGWNSEALSPGVGGFKLASVTIMNENDEPSNVLNIEKPLKLRITYHVDAPDLSFRCAASFYTQGACAFATVETRESKRTGGWYSSSVEIPGNLLSEGEYTVNLSVFSSRAKKVHLCKLSSVVAFQIFDPLNGISARGDYAEGLAGVMRPLLRWHSDSLNSSANI